MTDIEQGHTYSHNGVSVATHRDGVDIVLDGAVVAQRLRNTPTDQPSLVRAANALGLALNLAYSQDKDQLADPGAVLAAHDRFEALRWALATDAGLATATEAARPHVAYDAR